MNSIEQTEQKEIPNFTSLQAAIEFVNGNTAGIAKTDRISGGDINKAYALTLQNGKRVFMKANEKDNAAFFTAEALGLNALASCNKIKTPKILCTGTDAGDEAGFSFLLLEFIQSAPRTKNYWATFGRELAELHKTPCSQFVNGGKYGFLQHNFIGRTPQINTPKNSWIEFFREHRLGVQFRLAENWFDEAFHKTIEKFLKKLDELLIEPDTPSLLHGDLWSGNVYCGADGKAMLIDPATYIGFYEADLAMTELFGAFPREFYDAYREVTPKVSGYETRRDIYNLYQLLNHLNLFGGGYLNPVKEIVTYYTG